MPRSTLLLGEDHVLKVEATAFTESYKRFYFRDIQSVTVRTTRRRLIWNIVLTVLFALFLAEALFGSNTFGAWAVTMLIMASVVAGLLAVNNILGTTCEVHLQTAVQTENLEALSRVHRARRVLNRIRPLIAQAQGQLTPEEAVERITVGGTMPTGPLNL